jgi:hypothetical protein
MSELTEAERAELNLLRARVQELDRERQEEVAAANRAVAAAQERAYWLDRWHLDLNALMQRPGAEEFRNAVRIAREVIRTVRRAKRKLLR